MTKIQYYNKKGTIFQGDASPDQYFTELCQL